MFISDVPTEVASVPKAGRDILLAKLTLWLVGLPLVSASKAK